MICSIPEMIKAFDTYDIKFSSQILDQFISIMFETYHYNELFDNKDYEYENNLYK